MGGTSVSAARGNGTRRNLNKEDTTRVTSSPGTAPASGSSSARVRGQARTCRRLRLSAAVCYDATDLDLVADLARAFGCLPDSGSEQGRSRTFDNLAISLSYQMYQLVAVANNAQLRRKAAPTGQSARPTSAGSCTCTARSSPPWASSRFRMSSSTGASAWSNYRLATNGSGRQPATRKRVDDPGIARQVPPSDSTAGLRCSRTICRSRVRGHYGARTERARETSPPNAPDPQPGSPGRTGTTDDRHADPLTTAEREELRGPRRVTAGFGKSGRTSHEDPIGARGKSRAAFDAPRSSRPRRHPSGTATESQHSASDSGERTEAPEPNETTRRLPVAAADPGNLHRHRADPGHDLTLPAGTRCAPPPNDRPAASELPERRAAPPPPSPPAFATNSLALARRNSGQLRLERSSLLQCNHGTVCHGVPPLLFSILENRSQHGHAAYINPRTRNSTIALTTPP